MKCHNCGGRIRGSDPKIVIEISGGDYPTPGLQHGPGLGELFYHIPCFSEAAGIETLESLEDTLPEYMRRYSRPPHERRQKKSQNLQADFKGALRQGVRNYLGEGNDVHLHDIESGAY